MVYLGSFSKTFAPGLRVGWAVAPHAVREKLVLATESAILCPSAFSQLTVSSYLAGSRLAGPDQGLPRALPRAARRHARRARQPAARGRRGPTRTAASTSGSPCPTASTPRRCCRARSPRGWPTCRAPASSPTAPATATPGCPTATPTPTGSARASAGFAGVVRSELELIETFGTAAGSAPGSDGVRADRPDARPRLLSDPSGDISRPPYRRVRRSRRPHDPALAKEICMTHVLVLAGGLTHERDVSLRSGRRVADALRRAGLRDPRPRRRLQPARDAQRDPPGRRLAGAARRRPARTAPCATCSRRSASPYVGARPASCRLTWDKPVAKALVGAAGVSTPGRRRALPRDLPRARRRRRARRRWSRRLGLPLVVKPARGGSALGLSIVRTAEELPAAMVGCLRLR